MGMPSNWLRSKCVDDRGSVDDRGRDAGCPTPPAQIRTSPIKAYGVDADRKLTHL